jgi:hypothetical protein
VSNTNTNGVLAVLLGVAMAAASGGLAAVDANDRPARSTQETTATPSRAGRPAVLFSPDPELHPGAINRSLSKKTLCSDTFRTAQVRPPTSYTNRLKALELGDGGTITAPNDKRYTVIGEHLPGTIIDYELDHLISLQLGGHPVDPRNLWMEPWEDKGAHLADDGLGAESKDVLENRFGRAVCNGDLALSTAQRQMAEDWLSAR